MHKKISNKNYFKAGQEKPKTNFDIYPDFPKKLYSRINKRFL